VHRARLFLRKRLAQSMPMRDTASITAWAS
jgi:hypothetical protein